MELSHEKLDLPCIIVNYRHTYISSLAVQKDARSWLVISQADMLNLPFFMQHICQVFFLHKINNFIIVSLKMLPKGHICGADDVKV